MDKKANILDWFYILGILFMTGICIFVAYIIISNASSTNVFADVAEAQDAVDISERTIISFDNLMMFIIVGLSLFVLISSAMVFNHPAFFIIGFILLCIAVTFAAMISNTFYTFTTSTTIDTIRNQFPKILFLMEHLPIYVAFMGLSSSIVMYISYMRS
jgi:hypothetical protein